MIKIHMEKIYYNNKTLKTLAVSIMESRGGGYYSLSFIKLFRNIIFTVSTTSLWSLISMNKQYLTGLTCQCELLISPFDNRNLGCNGVLKTVKSGGFA